MDLIFNKTTLIYGVCLAPSYYIWKKLLNEWCHQAVKGDNCLDRNNDRTFQQRHNCVVTYGRKRMSGWYPHTNGVPWDTIDGIHKFSEPIIYFIETAKHSLDIAIMSIGISEIFKALKSAQQRGVKVRLILNFQSSKDRRMALNDLMDSGIPIQFFIAKNENMSNIMHHKYMVKDYNGNSDFPRGYAAMSSLNWTSPSTFFNNFESIAFTSNPGVVQDFHENFEECWKDLIQDNMDIFNRTVLASSGFKSLPSSLT